MHSVTLYHWEPNANSGKPMLALMEKGVAFNSHYLDLLNFDQHKPQYLAINPQGTIPAMLHGERVLTESTAIMEYVDEAFPGPPLMPADARDRWRVRWWMKFMDQWLGPSFSMIGWSVFVGPAVRSKDPEELKAAIERIPLPERRVAWRKAIHGQFSTEEMQESRRRVALGIRMLEEELAKRPWLASNQYSLADIDGFNLAYALPLSQPTLSNDELTPNILRWLRAIYARPATKACWAHGQHRHGQARRDPRAAAHRAGESHMNMTLYHGEPNGPSLTVLATLFAKGLQAKLVPIDLARGERHALAFAREPDRWRRASRAKGRCWWSRTRRMTDSVFIACFLDDVGQRGGAAAGRMPYAAGRLMTWCRQMIERTAPAAAFLGCRAHPPRADAALLQKIGSTDLAPAGS